MAKYILLCQGTLKEPHTITIYHFQCLYTNHTSIHTPILQKTVKLAEQESTAPKLTEKGTLQVQNPVGKILYYTTVLDNNLLMALNTILRQQKMPQSAQQC